MAAINWFRLWAQDIFQAYLQSKRPFSQDVCVKLKGCINLKEEHLLNLIKPLYGLTDSGDYRHNAMANHLTKNLFMKPITGDLACFSKSTDDKLDGRNGNHVDDSIEIGNEQFIE